MRDMTLGALTAPKLDIKSKGVVLPIPTPGSGVVIKPGILRLLPKFGGKLVTILSVISKNSLRYATSLNRRVSPLMI